MLRNGVGRLVMIVLIGSVLLSPLSLSGEHWAIAGAPLSPTSQFQAKKQWNATEIQSKIDELCEKYNFPYFTLMKWLANKESKYGQDKRCGDGGKSCGLYQYRKPTWIMLQKKFNREDLNYNNDIDQIEMTILALKNGYWYLWGPLQRRYKYNPI